MVLLADFSVIKPEPGLIFWSLIFFSIFWFLMSRLAFKPIANALKKRENDIQASLDEAKRAREEMAGLKAENEALLAQAREERAKILKEAKDAKDAIVTEAKEKAKAEADKVMATARQEIENQKMAAITEVKNQAGLMAIEIAEKVIRQQLQGNAAQEDYVKRLVDNFKMN